MYYMYTIHCMVGLDGKNWFYAVLTQYFASQIHRKNTANNFLNLYYIFKLSQ